MAMRVPGALLAVSLVAACSHGTTSLPDPRTADLQAHAVLSRASDAALAYFDSHDSFVGFDGDPAKGSAAVRWTGNVAATSEAVSLDLVSADQLVMSIGSSSGHHFCAGIEAFEAPPATSPLPPGTVSAGAVPPPSPGSMITGTSGAADAFGAKEASDCGPSGSDLWIPNFIHYDKYVFTAGSGWIDDTMPSCVDESKLRGAGNWPLDIIGRVAVAKYDGGTAVSASVASGGAGGDLSIQTAKFDPASGTMWLKLASDCYIGYSTFLGRG